MSIDTIAVVGHKSEALELIEVAHNAHHPESATAAATAALAHATLALVEQQRLANLIAFMVQYESPTGNNPRFIEYHGEKFAEITKGLGL